MKYNIQDISKYHVIFERIAAYLLDLLILTPNFVISLILFTFTSSVFVLYVWSFISFILIFCYFTFFVFLYGQTPGKMLLNIVVLGEDGRLPSLQQSILRSSAYFVTSIPILKLIDIIFVIFNAKRRSVRDFAAGTIVVLCDDKILKKTAKKILLSIILILVFDIITMQIFNISYSSYLYK